ncbi:MAG: VanZ family protein, partial [Ignavibacteria bacterium]|nr:VanZ family protein [Ignavibacteria bacterium]
VRVISLLVITGTPGSLTVYVNGILRREITRTVADSSDWNASYPILLGARDDGKYRWTGVLYSVRMLDRALSYEQMQVVPDSVSGTPVLLYDFSGVQTDSIQNTGTSGTGPIVIPKQFRPRHRAVLMDLGESGAPFPIWRDIVLNVLAFLPVGFMLSLVLPERMKPWIVLVVVVLATVSLSLSIELTQAYLPRRWSTFTDVWTNTLGGSIGAVISFSRFGRTVIQRIIP